MKTINATKGEFVNIINGLFAVQEIQSKEFGLLVSKNIALLKDELKELEVAGAPSPEFMKLANQVNELANKNEEDAQEKIDKIEKENQELVDSRREQMDKVQKMMEEEASMNLHILPETVLPDDITAKQINNILKIIE